MGSNLSRPVRSILLGPLGADLIPYVGNVQVVASGNIGGDRGDVLETVLQNSQPNGTLVAGSSPTKPEHSKADPASPVNVLQGA